MRNEQGKSCLAAALLAFGFAGRHHRVPPATGYGYWGPDPDFSAKLQLQDSGSNGIEVGELKIYDDSSLRMMLDQSRQRLAAINGLNESALVSHLGAVTGSRIDQTQFGVQVTGPSLLGTATTAIGPTSQTTTNTIIDQLLGHSRRDVLCFYTARVPEYLRDAMSLLDKFRSLKTQTPGVSKIEGVEQHSEEASTLIN
jgi:hypothetical protein